MIATILPGSSNFHAVEYNEKKVAQGSAFIIEMKNISGKAGLSDHTPEELQQFFMDYSERNDNIKKAQFHVAFSVKGNEMTHDQITSIAHRWLNEMGYGDDGQPVVIYGHTDTDNTHIHIVTSRVHPSGRKIDHSNERRRGRAVLEKILGENLEQKVTDDKKNVLENYRFENINQCRAIFDSIGYETFIKDNVLHLKRNGSVVDKISAEEIQQRCNPEVDNKALYRAKALTMKVAKQSENLEQFASMLHQQFGISVVWLGQKDSPYGYMLVDHLNKCVFTGGQVNKLGVLKSKFMLKEDRIEKSKEVVLNFLVNHPEASTKDINYELAKTTGAKIRKGELVVGSTKIPLTDDLKDLLKANDKVAWANGFAPTNEEERKVVCKFTGIKDAGRIRIASSPKDVPEEVEDEIRRILSSDELPSIPRMFEDAGLKEANVNGKFYCLDFKRQLLIDMSKYDVEKLKEAHIKVALSSIEQALDDDPTLTTRQLNSRLGRKLGGYVGKGKVHVAGEEVELDDLFANVLKGNDKIAWLAEFAPTTEGQRDLLCKMAGFKDVDKIPLSTEKKSIPYETAQLIADAYATFPPENLKEGLENLGLKVGFADGMCYCIDFRKKVIVDLGGMGYDVSIFLPQTRQAKKKGSSGINIKGGKKTSVGHSRDWEVGSASEYGDEATRRDGGLGR